MGRLSVVALCAAFMLAGCASDPTAARNGSAATAQEVAVISAAMLDEINRLRADASAAPIRLNAQLTAAAEGHARDMAAQNRAWHFGSDGSSPAERAGRAGYGGGIIGENIAENSKKGIPTLAAWMQERDTRDVIMDPAAKEMGLAWYQDPTGRLWWVLLMGG